jgi:uncharacterized protein YjbI with pentapeptide repeats
MLSEPAEHLDLEDDAERTVTWETCSAVSACTGVRLDEGPCLAHLGDDQLHHALSRLAVDRSIDARGVTFTHELLQAMLSALTPPEGREPLIARGDFTGAIFAEDAIFRHLQTQGPITFQDAIFKGRADFREAYFADSAHFLRATFEKHVSFERATFMSVAGFNSAVFNGKLSFHNVTFQDMTKFQYAKFTAPSRGAVKFTDSVFNREALFQHIAADGPIDFSRATFQTVTFKRAVFKRTCAFQSTQFKRHVYLQNASFGADIDWSNAHFGGAAFQGLVVAGRCSFARSNFLGEVNFDRASFHGVTEFKGSDFAGPTSYHSVEFDRADFYGTRFRKLAKFDKALFRLDARFVLAKFDGEARFTRARFDGEVSFQSATFQSANFSECIFNQSIAFHKATFHGPAYFARTEFGSQQPVLFHAVVFSNRASYERATFTGDGEFNRAQFKGRAVFTDAHFKAAARFYGATFQDRASFARVQFDSVAGFSSVTAKDSIGFERATFSHARQLGPMLVRRSLVLEAATFRERVRVDASAAVLCALQTRFLAGAQIRVRWADVLLDDADFGGPSLLTTATPFVVIDETSFSPAWRRLPGGCHSERSRLLAVRRADVGGLSLSNIDLSLCRFAGAHNLDRLRIDSNVSFGYSPPAAWRTHRRVIAEEQMWRSRRRWAPAWQNPWWPVWAESNKELPSGDIGSIYRSLRKGREDQKDEPGAADFYYGEMEMRRHLDRRPTGDQTQPRSTVERLILTTYWLVSGYGLRAWRALCSFIVLAMVLAWLLVVGGFEHPLPLYESVLYTVRTAIGLPRTPQPELTVLGDVVQIVARISLPVLLGLAILSVRGRVKRQ